VTKLTHPNGSVLFIQRPKELQAFLAAQPRVLPFYAQRPGIGPKALRLTKWLLLAMLLILAITAAFFLFGEERATSVVRPALTARQRANAFRL
jgi:hypothetical protein